MNKTYQLLAAEVSQRVRPVECPQQFWLAITGPPGSGKSTLSQYIAAHVGDLAMVIPMDGYHYYRSELDAMPDPATAHLRRGAPFTFNAERFANELLAARETGSGTFPSFQHDVGDPVEQAICLDVDKHRLVMVEGNYLLLPDDPWTRIEPLFDESWFIDAELDVIRARLINRKMACGYDEAGAVEQVETNDIPNAKLCVESCRMRANRRIKS